eukprot:CAMPEP_0197638018 /NCGR_PEP_ID=MMETSP1338-20131121/13057_1 /TAXON_ID=43686 ORGANISM="Pelagodinium beii, Strain RCC1491" /NCGR_SAMPLE_ID=MMETSP1338 /ASSEMBLY_ACC=CAM_ASM_000754 /LENGTH=511 /DNA_ID=CAMNT_0043210523 /DNA_START=91 /DNA_END=1626 /DNA_ORIENTATION=-
MRRYGPGLVRGVRSSSSSCDFSVMMRDGFSGSDAKPFSELPGPKYPMLGALPTFLSYGVGRMPEYYDHLYDTYGVVVDGSILSDRTAVICDPREFRKVFQHEGKYPQALTSDAWPVTHFFDKFKQPYNSLVKEGKEWQKGRHALQKDIFSTASASSYCEPVTQACDEVVENFGKRVAQGPVDIETEMVNAVSDVFSAAVLGKSLGVSSGSCPPEAAEWVEDSMRVIQLSAQLIMQPHMKVYPEAFALYREFETLFGKTNEATQKMVMEAVERYKDFEGPEDELPYVARVQRRGEISDDVLGTEVQGIVMAGLDTTFHVLLWNILNLAQYPAAQEALRQEVHQVLGPEAHFSREKLSEMPYLKAVMRESQRYTPAAPILTFRFLDEDLALCGYNIPAKTRIVMSVEAIQKDPRIVDDPHVFRPERFLADAVEARKGDPLKSILDHKLLGTPFSFGARMCLGARLADVEIMTLLSKFTSKFKFELTDKNQTWSKTLRTMSIPDPIPQVTFTPL